MVLMCIAATSDRNRSDERFDAPAGPYAKAHRQQFCGMAPSHLGSSHRKGSELPDAKPKQMRLANRPSSEAQAARHSPGHHILETCAGLCVG